MFPPYTMFINKYIAEKQKMLFKISKHYTSKSCQWNRHQDAYSLLIWIQFMFISNNLWINSLEKVLYSLLSDFCVQGPTQSVNLVI